RTRRVLLKFTLSYSQAKSAAALVGPAGGRLVFPAVARRVVALEDRGAERRVAPPVKCARLGGRARPLGEGNAAPFGAPHGVGRPAGGSPFDGAVPALALVV